MPTLAEGSGTKECDRQHDVGSGARQVGLNRQGEYEAVRRTVYFL